MDAGIYPADPERDGKYQQDSTDSLGRIVRKHEQSASTMPIFYFDLSSAACAVKRSK
jgi:hypothetical protein